MAEQKQMEALKAAAATKAETPERAEREDAPVADSNADTGEVQLSIRLRPELKDAILDEARQRRMSVKTLVLSALRDAGLPVEDSDLLDRRNGAPRRPPAQLRSQWMEMPRVDGSRTGDRPGRMPTPELTSDLTGLAAMLLDLIGRRTGTASGPNIKISTGCCCGHQSAAKRNSSNRHRRK